MRSGGGLCRRYPAPGKDRVVMAIEQGPATLLTSLALVLVMALAVRQDLVQHRISNVLTFGALAVGIVIHSALGGTGGLIHAIAGGGVGLACLLPFYLCKGMGAGDVKLMAAAGAFLGPFNAFVAAFLALAFGAVLAIAVVIWRVVESRAAMAGASTVPGGAVRTSPITSQIRKERFPYAPAIGLGVLVALWRSTTT